MKKINLIGKTKSLKFGRIITIILLLQLLIITSIINYSEGLNYQRFNDEYDVVLYNINNKTENRIDMGIDGYSTRPEYTFGISNSYIAYLRGGKAKTISIYNISSSLIVNFQSDYKINGICLQKEKFLYFNHTLRNIYNIASNDHTSIIIDGEENLPGSIYYFSDIGPQFYVFNGDDLNHRHLFSYNVSSGESDYLGSVTKYYFYDNNIIFSKNNENSIINKNLLNGTLSYVFNGTQAIVGFAMNDNYYLWKMDNGTFYQKNKFNNNEIIINIGVNVDFFSLDNNNMVILNNDNNQIYLYNITTKNLNAISTSE